MVIDWNYLNAAETEKLPTWKVVVPPNAAVAGYYYQAINKDAPHPAAARLWQEFLYSDEGQNLFAAGGVRPVRADKMVQAGTIDKAVVDKIPVVDGPVTVPTPSRPTRPPSTWRTTGPRRSADRVARRLRDALPLLPFLAVVVIFLIIPTVTVIVSSVYADGVFSFARIQALFSDTALNALVKSVLLSGSTALIGAVLGAVLAWLIVSSPPTSMVRRAVISLCSVLAQFGGVALAFAFLATVGLNGVLTLWVQQVFGWNLAGSGWLYSLGGLMLVYTYFQIPLMVIVFVPALEGLRDQWREAAVSLGASTWRYWREVAIPLLTPAFLGSALLLFANAFAAYATAAALVSQGSPILPLLIRAALTSEVVLGQAGFAYALALEMIVVVAVVMVAYNALVKRTARWLR